MEKNKNTEVHKHALNYPQLALRAMKEFAAPKKISNKEILRALALLDYLPLKATNKELTKAARSKDWLIRLAAGLHPDATEAQLNLLANDTDKNIASASVMALNSKQ